MADPTVTSTRTDLALLRGSGSSEHPGTPPQAAPQDVPYIEENHPGEEAGDECRLEAPAGPGGARAVTS